MDNFDLKKYLVENKMTTNSKVLNEALTHSEIVDAARKLQASKFIKFLEKTNTSYSIENQEDTLNPNKGSLDIAVNGMEEGEVLWFLDGEYQGGNS